MIISATVDLNDRLTFRQKSRIHVVEHNYVPSNHKNLAYSTAQLFIQRYN